MPNDPEYIFDAVLFACLGGTYAGCVDVDPVTKERRDAIVGLLFEEMALPIATLRPASEHHGFAACWESERNVETFFRDVGVGDHILDGPGLWVLATAYTEDWVERGEWAHLTHELNVRRPEADEMARVAAGLPPWEGGDWL